MLRQTNGLADRLELNYGEVSGRERAIAADVLRWARKLTDVQGHFLCVIMKDWYDAVTDAINELEPMPKQANGLADRLELNYGELSGRERAIAADVLRWARKLTDVQGYFLCVLMRDWYDAVTDAINELEQ